jgi:hypothetical protein
MEMSLGVFEKQQRACWCCQAGNEYREAVGQAEANICGAVSVASWGASKADKFIQELNVIGVFQSLRVKAHTWAEMLKPGDDLIEQFACRRCQGQEFGGDWQG